MLQDHASPMNSSTGVHAGIRGRARSVHMARSYTLKDLCFAPSSKLRWSNSAGEEVCRSTNVRPYPSNAGQPRVAPTPPTPGP